MLKPNFFKAYSRIGIHNLPHGQRTRADGVEKAPDHILNKSFLDNFPNAKVSSFEFTKPENIAPFNYFKTIYEECLNFKEYIKSNLENTDTLVVVGGDHSVTFSSLLADYEKHDTEMGIIHFDSHPDFNLYKNSPSQNFHGMYLRIFFDKFDLPYFDKTVKNKFSLENLLFIGNLELDEEETIFFEKNKMNIISSLNLKNNKKEALEMLTKFVRTHSHVHISFDVDVFDKKIVSATGTPAKNGFNRKDVFLLLDIIKEAKSFSLDIAEVNPRKKGAKKTIKIAQEVLTKLLK